MKYLAFLFMVCFISFGVFANGGNTDSKKDNNEKTELLLPQTKTTLGQCIAHRDDSGVTISCGAGSQVCKVENTSTNRVDGYNCTMTGNWDIPVFHGLTYGSKTVISLTPEVVKYQNVQYW
jgi:hypothetical protein